MIGPASSLSGMTQHPGSPLLPADAPSPERERGEPTTGALGVGRLIGVDLARGLAVFGMYAVHVGPAPSQDGAIGFLMELAQGRSSALFAVLAGFAVALITGRRTPKTGLAYRQAVAKVVIRAVTLMALGTALTMTGTPVVPILAFYGLFFLLVPPLHRLGAEPPHDDRRGPGPCGPAVAVRAQVRAQAGGRRACGQFAAYGAAGAKSVATRAVDALP